MAVPIDTVVANHSALTVLWRQSSTLDLLCVCSWERNRHPMNKVSNLIPGLGQVASLLPPNPSPSIPEVCHLYLLLLGDPTCPRNSALGDHTEANSAL